MGILLDKNEEIKVRMEKIQQNSERTRFAFVARLHKQLLQSKSATQSRLRAGLNMIT
jgi:uncharacterized protein YdcH (DUF465 family)